MSCRFIIEDDKYFKDMEKSCEKLTKLLYFSFFFFLHFILAQFSSFQISKNKKKQNVFSLVLKMRKLLPPNFFKKNVDFYFSPDVRRVAVIVRQLEEIVGAALLVGEGALHPRLQHVLRDLVAAVHALQVLLAATLF